MIYRVVRFVSIFLGWLCFFVYINDNSQKIFLYALPFVLTIGLIMKPIQEKIENGKEHG